MAVLLVQIPVLNRTHDVSDAVQQEVDLLTLLLMHEIISVAWGRCP